jgi:pilus assembly protein Flp/PilA
VSGQSQSQHTRTNKAFCLPLYEIASVLAIFKVSLMSLRQNSFRSQDRRIVVRFVKNLWSNESGATAIEYGLIAALIAVAIIGAATTVGGNLATTFGNVASSL